MDKWPKKLMLRNTELYDDMGGKGQRIFTTAGFGYEKRDYYSSDYVIELQQRIAELEAAAVELRYALQDRWAANSDSELYKANARVESADSTLAALLPGRGE